MDTTGRKLFDYLFKWGGAENKYYSKHMYRFGTPLFEYWDLCGGENDKGQCDDMVLLLNEALCDSMEDEA